MSTEFIWEPNWRKKGLPEEGEEVMLDLAKKESHTHRHTAVVRIARIVSFTEAVVEPYYGPEWGVFGWKRKVNLMPPEEDLVALDLEIWDESLLVRH